MSSYVNNINMNGNTVGENNNYFQPSTSTFRKRRNKYGQGCLHRAGGQRRLALLLITSASAALRHTARHVKFDCYYHYYHYFQKQMEDKMSNFLR